VRRFFKKKEGTETMKKERRKEKKNALTIKILSFFLFFSFFPSLLFLKKITAQKISKEKRFCPRLDLNLYLY